MSPGRRLRALIAEQTILLPGAFNALAARLVESLQFPAVYISGAGVTNTLLGVPDAGLITLTEMAQQCRLICQSVRIPCIADADTGFGETLNVARTVREMESAGLAGIHLEDQVSPKRCGHLPGKQLVAPLDMAAKIAAAAKARRDPDFFLIARTDARAIEGLDAAVRRAHLYLEAGADAVFPEALESEEEFAEFARRVPAPLLANMTEFGKSPLLSVPRLAEMGYRMVIFPMTQLRVMMKAAQSALRELRETGTQTGFLERMQTREELYRLIDYAAYEAFDAEVAAWVAERAPDSPPVTVRAIEDTDRGWIRRELQERWGSARMVSRGRVHDIAEQPGFIALIDGNRAGLLTYRLYGVECEVTIMHTAVRGAGVGTALIDAAEQAAAAAGCRRLWLITTNDNVEALRFYQRRGFRIAAVHPGAVAHSRQLKPEIPVNGRHGIPIRDEIELEKELREESE